MNAVLVRRRWPMLAVSLLLSGGAWAQANPYSDRPVSVDKRKAGGESHSYTGRAEFDGQGATLSLTIQANGSVSGKLHKDKACGSNMRLNAVDVNFNGSVQNGPWSNKKASIGGNWTGQATTCDGKVASDYSKSGDIVIKWDGGKIKARIKASGGWYVFNP